MPDKNLKLKDYIVTWTDIHNAQHKNHVQGKNEADALSSLHTADIFKRIDKIEKAVWDENAKFIPSTGYGQKHNALEKWIPIPPLYPHSKFKVYDKDKVDFDTHSLDEYLSEHPENGEIPNFETATIMANDMQKVAPDLQIDLFVGKNNKWWIGKFFKNLDEDHFRVSQAYFQGGGGVNEPEPKKKKYKSEKAIVVQPRFKEPFYNNYDLYDVEGVDGPAKHGPGAGWHDMGKYKSISEFLKAKRKRMKDKYKADDSWIEDTESNRKERVKNMKVRAFILSKIIKKAIDFPADQYIDPEILSGSEGGSVAQSNLMGGYLDKYLPENDFEGKDPTKLDFGRDYTEDADNEEQDPDEKLDELAEKYTAPTHGLFGLPDGVDLADGDLEPSSSKNPYYGTTDLGISIY